MRFQIVEVQLGIAEQYVLECLNRAPVSSGWYAAINQTAVISILIREIDDRVVTQGKPCRWIDPDTLTIIKIPVVVELLVHGVEAKCGSIAV